MAQESNSSLWSNNLRSGIIDFTAGSLGGVAQVYVSQPLDTVKVKQQAFPLIYRSMNDCIMRTFRKDGIQGLYAGSVPAAIANLAENSVLFVAYGFCQKLIGSTIGVRDVNDLSVLGNAFAGFLASFFSTFALCPTELIKCKLQVFRETGHKCSSTMVLAQQIYRLEGISGFFRGLNATFVREMPGYFCFFGGYEGARQILAREDQRKDEIGPIKTMAAGSFGGIMLWITIFPADVIKSRMQINNLSCSMLDVGVSIYKEEGLMAFYSGLFPTVIRTIPATATLFLVYEYTKKALSHVI